MFAPKMTEIACGSVMRSAETKPITMTVVAELLCRTDVTSMPAIAPITGFLVRNARTFFIFSPAARCSASLIEFMPNKNIARPPASPNIVVTISFMSYSPRNLPSLTTRATLARSQKVHDTGGSIRFFEIPSSAS